MIFADYIFTVLVALMLIAVLSYVYTDDEEK